MNAISVEGVSKRYRIGRRHDRYRTIRGAIAGAAAGLLHRREAAMGGEMIWALWDISLNVEQGDVLGIVGPNGAGKTTLLKILSRITYPTEGRVRLRGRVGSLLEVGTGFHPELTGRENIFLNGAILGMRRREIREKFDQIVDFAEIGRFIDTPVKRYSSGMYVRLAFAVAAHLEPEILLVDEVLAVGDVSFQRKCIGKMSDVARGGRTVLFVSHNMASVESLCPRAVLLEGGRITAEGRTREVIQRYLGGVGAGSGELNLLETGARSPGSRRVLRRLRLIDTSGKVVPHAVPGEDITFEIDGESAELLSGAALAIRINTAFGQRIATCHSRYQSEETVSLEGAFRVRCTMRNCRLMPGPYTLMLVLTADAGMVDQIDALPFEVVESDVYGTGKMLPGRCGYYLPEVSWDFQRGRGGS